MRQGQLAKNRNTGDLLTPSRSLRRRPNRYRPARRTGAPGRGGRGGCDIPCSKCTLCRACVRLFHLRLAFGLCLTLPCWLDSTSGVPAGAEFYLMINQSRPIRSAFRSPSCTHSSREGLRGPHRFATEQAGLPHPSLLESPRPTTSRRPPSALLKPALSSIYPLWSDTLMFFGCPAWENT